MSATMKRRYNILGAIVLLLGLAVVSAGLFISHDAACGTAPALPVGAPTMKAIVYRCYGPARVLRYEDTAKPVPKDNEVLVRVHANSLNPLDWHYMLGTPYLVRLESGIGVPKDPRLGVDFAGTIETVGTKVTRFQPGNEVFGGRYGAFAEYIAVAQDRAIALKPANMTFEQAAAVPIAAVTALQALRDKGRIKAGQQVLINGASGGVGTFAVQIAKSYGAEVTGVCSGRNAAMVRDIGADHVVDYTQEDFTKGSQHFDLIIDTVGSHTFAEYRRVLAPKGILVMVGEPMNGDWFAPFVPMVKALVMAPFQSQEFVPILAELKQADLDYLRDLMQSGKVKPVVDRHYPLSEAATAIAYLQQGHARGKVVMDSP
jgi:NADPH:quinone reductase-like Zn-dependent oxidoreductase